MKKTHAPVIVFGYNRPQHLRNTLDTLAEAEGANFTPLWLFCDGPKPGQQNDQVDAVRVVAEERYWLTRFASVKVTSSETNKGLAQSIIQGVSKVLLKSDSVIVLEDDLLVAPDFLTFMNACLEFYSDDTRVGSVTGFCPLAAQHPGYKHDVMAVPRNCSHGWATWSNRWCEVDWDARAANELWQNSALRRRFNSTGNDRLDRLNRQLAGQIDSWSIRFGLWQTLSGRFTIYPVHNRVRNIGFDGSGVHTLPGQDVNAQALTQACPYLLTRVSEEPAILRRFARIYGGAWYKRWLRGLRGETVALLKGPQMRRWNKHKTEYSRASEHYDLDYFKDQTRDGDLRGEVNAWKFEGLVRPELDILDFGCGDGALLQVLGGKNGVEVNPHARASARARGFKIEETLDAFGDASVDLIISNHCLEHVENPVAALRSMHRVLRPNGTLAIVVPCHRAAFAYQDADRDFHLFSWSAANLGNMVRISGFDVLKAQELPHRWPPMWRLIHRRLGHRVFHAASRLWARIDRSASQVICIARPRAEN